MEQHFKVTGMTCAACSAGIQKTVGKMKGVNRAEVSLMGESMAVDFDENTVSAEQIIAAVEGLGYGASIDDGSALPKPQENAAEKSESGFAAAAKNLKTRFLASLCFLVPLMYFTMGHMFGAPLPYFWNPHTSAMNFALVQLVLTTPVLFINIAFFKSGIRAAFKRVRRLPICTASSSCLSSACRTASGRLNLR